MSHFYYIGGETLHRMPCAGSNQHTVPMEGLDAAMQLKTGCSSKVVIEALQLCLFRAANVFAGSCITEKKYKTFMESHNTALHTANRWLGSFNAPTRHKDRVVLSKSEESCVNCRWDHTVTQGDMDFLLVNNILHY